ncbi:MAG: PHP domain-containing protein, partial [Caulobacteraceae bacterium]
VQARLHVAGAEGDHAELIVDGRPANLLADPVLHTADTDLDFTLPADSNAHWFRADVRAPDGRRVLIGNPIYLDRF